MTLIQHKARIYRAKNVIKTCKKVKIKKKIKAYMRPHARMQTICMISITNAILTRLIFLKNITNKINAIKVRYLHCT